MEQKSRLGGVLNPPLSIVLLLLFPTCFAYPKKGGGKFPFNWPFLMEPYAKEDRYLMPFLICPAIHTQEDIRICMCLLWGKLSQPSEGGLLRSKTLV